MDLVVLEVPVSFFIHRSSASLARQSSPGGLYPTVRACVCVRCAEECRDGVTSEHLDEFVKEKHLVTEAF